jgi:hypothetical protein
MEEKLTAQHEQPQGGDARLDGYHVREQPNAHTADVLSDERRTHREESCVNSEKELHGHPLIEKRHSSVLFGYRNAPQDAGGDTIGSVL